jgi:hypothetical protein
MSAITSTQVTPRPEQFSERSRQGPAPDEAAPDAHGARPHRQLRHPQKTRHVRMDPSTSLCTCEDTDLPDYEAGDMAGDDKVPYGRVHCLSKKHHARRARPLSAADGQMYTPL